MKSAWHFIHFCSKPKLLCLIALLCLASACDRGTISSGAKMQKSVEELAQSGDPAAQNQWGLDLINGNGVSKNPEKGVEWIQKAAGHNHPKAQYNLALMHQTGKWVAPNLNKAFDLMFKAGRQGLPEAQAALGFMYEKGQGTSLDISEALYWYRRAATYGKVCESSRAHFKNNLLSHRREQYLYGDRDAQYMLGRIYETGVDGVIPNIEEAVHWYEDAAVRGDVASQARLAVMYGIQGKPRIDKSTGYAWAKLAADAAKSENMKLPYERLQSLLSPTEKAVAESVYQQLSKRVTFNVQDLGLSS